MPNLKRTTFPTVHTIISEFRAHVGEYWRDSIYQNKVVIVRKSFNEDGATIFLNKALFDSLVARALRIPVHINQRKNASDIQRVIRGPDPKKQDLTEIVKNTSQ